MLPPHFDSTSVPQFLAKCGGWKALLPAFDSYPAGYKALVPRMYASLVHYHRQGWLSANVCSSHPFFSSPAYLMLCEHGSTLKMDPDWLLDHNQSTSLQVQLTARSIGLSPARKSN